MRQIWQQTWTLPLEDDEALARATLDDLERVFGPMHLERAPGVDVDFDALRIPENEADPSAMGSE